MGLLVRQNLLIICWFTLCFLTGDNSCVAQDAQSQMRREVKRWAIVCSTEVRETGLPDLLTAKLTDVSGIELVERDLLDEVANELRISNDSFADTRESRLKLGSRLGADSLLLISSKKSKKQEILHVIICECRYGARLHEFVGDTSAYNVDELANLCAETVKSVHARFADGVKQIVGVAPFQSLNLTHELDQYQQGFRYILESSLLTYDGVAVVEIDEARAIQKELAIANSNQKQREAAPTVLVNGKFETEKSETNLEYQLQFHIQATNEQENGWEYRADTLDQVIEYLKTELPAKLIENDIARDGGGIELQLEWLTRQADSFSLRGDWNESTGLREAAILLTPENASLRTKNIADYIAYCSTPLNSTAFADPDQRRTEGRRLLSNFQSYHDHFEFLIRNRQLTVNQAIKLTRTSRVFDSNLFRLVSPTTLRMIRNAERDFARQVSPKILDLEREPRSDELSLRLQLHSFQVNSLIKPFARGSQLDTIVELATIIIPEGSPIPGEFLSLCRRHPQRSEKNWKRFVTQLSSSDNRNGEILARYIQLNEKVNSVNSKTVLKDLLDEATRLLEDYDQMPYPVSSIDQSSRRFEPLRKQLNQLCKRLTAQSNGSSLPSFRSASKIVRVDNSDAVGFVQQSPIRISYKSLDGKKTDILTHKMWPRRISFTDERFIQQTRLYLTPCGEVDVWWNEGLIAIMRDKGLIEEVIVDRDAMFSDVCWDGANIWIASRMNGVSILNAKTLKTTHTCSENEGLPASNGSLLLLPIKKGLVFASGSFGKSSRAWCANIQLSQRALTPDVFHQATKVDQATVDWIDSEAAFFPTWLAWFENDQGKKRILVSRAPPSMADGRNMTTIDAHRPLIVDPTTKSVSVFDRTMYLNLPSHYSMQNRDTFLSREGTILRCRGLSVFQEPENVICRLDDKVVFAQGHFAERQISERFIKKDNDVIIAGIRWIVLDVETLEQSMYASEQADALLGVKSFYGDSVHYGLIGWDDWSKKKEFNFVQFKLVPKK